MCNHLSTKIEIVHFWYRALKLYRVSKKKCLSGCEFSRSGLALGLYLQFPIRNICAGRYQWVMVVVSDSNHLCYQVFLGKGIFHVRICHREIILPFIYNQEADSKGYGSILKAWRSTLMIHFLHLLEVHNFLNQQVLPSQYKLFRMWVHRGHVRFIS